MNAEEIPLDVEIITLPVKIVSGEVSVFGPREGAKVRINTKFTRSRIEGQVSIPGPLAGFRITAWDQEFELSNVCAIGCNPAQMEGCG